ncbi:MAG: hypothetical protein BMS9Abin26_1915 [Gammaproteobacteria bacterium]|nr:MAG: hypothetical protein BMS9Abin26_1915 [Gammaproteobacteria bacterium]
MNTKHVSGTVKKNYHGEHREDTGRLKLYALQNIFSVTSVSSVVKGFAP